jgi:hypothetical protein
MCREHLLPCAVSVFYYFTTTTKVFVCACFVTVTGAIRSVCSLMFCSVRFAFVACVLRGWLLFGVTLTLLGVLGWRQGVCRNRRRSGRGAWAMSATSSASRTPLRSPTTWCARLSHIHYCKYIICLIIYVGLLLQCILTNIFIRFDLLVFIY